MNTSEQMPKNQYTTGLPAPALEALEHSQSLCHRIRAEILRAGHISFHRFMQMSLYEPGLGYYSAGAKKIGHAGDFITAPEISSLFTHCLAVQCHQILLEINNGVILEVGPGSGVMMCSLLKVLEEKNALPESYLVLEPGADLRNRQQQLVRERIPHLEHRISWLDQLPDQPFEGMIIGNEVLDAMPVNRIVLKDGHFLELCVNVDGESFGWSARELNNQLQSQVELVLGEFVPGLPDGYMTELNAQIGSWIFSMTSILNRGAMLFIDYGYPRREYYHPQRIEGTLLCHYRHKVHHNPFIYPGLQDITASVDFTSVAEAAVAAGIQVSGYTTQAHFLMNCGLEAVMNEYNLTTDMDRVELGRQVRMLTMPGEMGERFKVIALTKDLDIPLMGFRNFDQRQRL